MCSLMRTSPISSLGYIKTKRELKRELKSVEFVVSCHTTLLYPLPLLTTSRLTARLRCHLVTRQPTARRPTLPPSTVSPRPRSLMERASSDRAVDTHNPKLRPNGREKRLRTDREQNSMHAEDCASPATLHLSSCLRCQMSAAGPASRMNGALTNHRLILTDLLVLSHEVPFI